MMKVDRTNGSVKLTYDACPDHGIGVLSEEPFLMMSFYDRYILHEWDYMSEDYINHDDPDMGTREQRFVGSQTILRDAIVEANIRPYTEEGLYEENSYAQGKWKLTIYLASGNSWSFPFSSEQGARFAYGLFHDYITDKSKLP